MNRFLSTVTALPLTSGSQPAGFRVPVEFNNTCRRRPPTPYPRKGMKNVRKYFISLAVSVVLMAACSSSGAGSGDSPNITASSTSRTSMTVVVNARLYTVDPARPWAEAFAYDSKGVIVAVGTKDEVVAVAGVNPARIDAKDNLVMPGFQDTHVHVPEAGINEDVCLLEPDKQLDDYAKEIRACLKDQDGAPWVRAAGASLFNLRGETGRLPIDVLDALAPDRPAIILDDLGHSAWTNTKGLAAAGITADAPDPQGGVYLRDPVSGRMTGLLLENAQQLVRNASALDDATNYKALLVALKELARNGITTVSDAGGFWGQNHPAAWKKALESGTLTVRGVNSLYLYPQLDHTAQLAEFKARFANDKQSLLQFDTVKIYIDGILDLGTAAMIEPYDKPIDPTYPNGFRYFKTEELQQYVNELHAIGYRAEFHVIGDAATRTALDVIAAIPVAKEEIAARRHRTTHTYLVHADDVKRFAEIGMIADFQAGPESAATEYHEYLTEFIGDRARDLLPMAKLIDAGARVSLSSDWDADPLSPFGIISRAVTRDKNAVKTDKAISMMTIEAAYALGQEDITGSITVGKFADYIIVDRNVVEDNPKDIVKATVLLTTLAGREVYRDKAFKA
jgi:predicted amidohydrolase YtcJ